MYEYYTEIHFANGTSREIHAGITSFLLVYPSVNGDLESMNLTFEDIDSIGDVPLRTNFTVELTLPSKALLQGSEYNIRAVLHRTGLTNISEDVQYIGLEYNPTSTPGPKSMTPYNITGYKSRRLQYDQLCATLGSVERVKGNSFDQGTQFPMSFPEELEVANPVVTSTCLQPTFLPLSIGDYAIPTFTTYYKQLGGQLIMALVVREKKPRQPEEHDEDLYDWLPWPKPKENADSFNSRMLRATKDISVFSAPSSHESDIAFVHYLSADARTPVFVDVSMVDDLLSRPAEERESLAPLAEPIIREAEKGTEAVFRYYVDYRKPPIYVGMTWMKKMRKMEESLANSRDASSQIPFKGN
ncbi:hypothetical protein SERLA73DRAFT_190942 [Serpula lacrymans var. lacrymans S7.3]|uniref:Uncharacterized protein n=2 Tax=Serpula lacrymans var. lacrymans TaxID=341189 RepID=F8QGN5_SERL3|nr:uncharacterized protein SERLADRAFT_456931 [Serpula lacrymans var. lacrymans S7.9]EGN92581.1 hypothetical protein SERLA73DRAFT_190942 [Serpula lacrymans var. lacrymans S7.3]EGO29328.1 hypothetical protein SERLADRAFT_456931 [Serpula lacrymans var. lacrymans S7.9]